MNSHIVPPPPPTHLARPFPAPSGAPAQPLHAVHPRVPVTPQIIDQAIALITLAAIFTLIGAALLALARHSRQISNRRGPPSTPDDPANRLLSRMLTLGRYSCYTGAALQLPVVTTLVYCAVELLTI